MKRLFLSLLVSMVFISVTMAQLKKGQIDLTKIPFPQSHYLPEYTFDVSTDPVSWSKQKAGLHVAFGSTDELYLRKEVPSIGQELKKWEKIGWRGERLNAQILIWSPDSLEQIRFHISDLKSASGKVIRKNNVKFNMVRYVISNLPYAANNFDCGAPLDSAWLMPDRLEPFDRFDLPGKTVRPVWVSIEIPRTAEPGKYSGTIEISSKNENVTLQLNVIVQKQILPFPHDWKFRLDLWQNPWVIANYYHVAPWSDEHKALLKKHLKLYADAGGKYITTYAVYSSWGDNSYMIEGTMIDWIKRPNGSWNFNYSIFDQYINLAMEVGIDKAITIYTPLPWGQRFRYMDEKSGNYIYEEWTPDSEQFKIFWNIFLDDLKAHLIQKGWFKKTYLGINENPIEATLAAIKVIKAHSKDWKITYAGDWHPELSSFLADYSTIITSEPSPKELKDRTAKGRTTTYYVCCNPTKPNTFVFSPPVEGRYISWYAAASGYGGFLRWAYDAWSADPMRDARHILWPAGDCFLVYPGGNSSIRFEKLREGIVDYEKILILRALALKSDDKNVKALIKDLNILLAAFRMQRDYSKRDYSTDAMIEALREGNKLINDLSSKLGH